MSTNVKESNIKAYIFNEDTKQSEECNIISRDLIGNKVTFQTLHFSSAYLGGFVGKSNDFVRIFTIDGLDFINTFLTHFHGNTREAYLARTLRENLNINKSDLRLSAADIYSYVQIDPPLNATLSWSGEAGDTSKIIEHLTNKIKEEFYIAKKENKKFIVITHSWGTVLGHLALSYADISPDLFITLSSPLGSNFLNKYILSIFYPPAMWANLLVNSGFLNVANTTGAVQLLIENYVNNKSKEATDVMDKSEIKKDYMVSKWINVWDDGDVISGPLFLQYSKFAMDFEDVNHSFYSNRTFNETRFAHAITSLDNTKMTEEGVDVNSANVIMLKEKIHSEIIALYGSSADADWDGVHPFLDKCPNTTRGEEVGIDGCSSSQVPQGTFSHPLNDTGITWGGNYPSGNNADCTSNIGAPQDCHHGRDATHNDDSDGHAGFSYTKLDSGGNNLPANATQWSCVRDNVTGLVWEVKTDDGGIHDKDNTYRWGGKTALGSGFGTYYSDWDSLVDGSNNEQLCGFSDWRVPTRQELQGLVHYGGSSPSIDTAYFPNTPSSYFYSALPVSNVEYNAWVVFFYQGTVENHQGVNRFHVRLVRSGQ